MARRETVGNSSDRAGMPGLAFDMMTPDSLPAWLARRAETAPREPWLFFRDALDWTWLSFRQTADQVARTADRLDLAPGAPAAFSGRLDPDLVVLDLAIQARGGRSVVDPRVATIPVEMPAPRSRLRRFEPVVIDPSYAEKATVVVANDTGAAGGASAEWDMPTLVGHAARLAATLGSALDGIREPRPIALACGNLRDPGIRTLLAWTLLADAVVALEPDVELAAQAVAWNRPHLAVVPGDQVERVRAAVAEQKPRWRRLVWLGDANDALGEL